MAWDVHTATALTLALPRAVAGNAVRAFASSGFGKIKVENPVVDLDGDEMTRWVACIHAAPCACAAM